MTIRPRVRVDEWYGEDPAAHGLVGLGRAVLVTAKGIYLWCRWAMFVLALPFILIPVWFAPLTAIVLLTPVQLLVNWRRGELLLPRRPVGAMDWREFLLPRSIRIALVPPRSGMLSRVVRSLSKRL
ncbi:MAG: hypothetical protein ACRDVE_22580 [Actinocrinis sp.]